MLGIADLHTPEAVAAAESAIGNGHPLNSLAASSSESESEDTSDESESDDEASDDTESDGEDNGNDNNKTCKSGNNDSTEGIVKQCSKRQRKIVELSWRLKHVLLWFWKVLIFVVWASMRTRPQDAGEGKGHFQLSLLDGWVYII